MMFRIPRNPRFWLGAFILWFLTLWGFSSFALAAPGGPEIPYFDKIAHFGYFFGGGGLLSAYFFRRNPESPNWNRLMLTTVLLIAVVGALDEYHQSFTPGRSGNDVFDWLADVSGATAGTLVFRWLHGLLK
jgi:VanZ family protein